MPNTTPLINEVPHRQHDRERQPSSSPRTEQTDVRNSDTLESPGRNVYGQEEDINFNGSER